MTVSRYLQTLPCKLYYYLSTVIFSGFYIPSGPYSPHLALLPITQLVLSRYPSDIAIEVNYLAFCPRDRTFTISTLARARSLTLTCAVPQMGLASHAYFRSASRSAPQVLGYTVLTMAAAAR
eukprot:1303436-Pleurochrysis_carterae.AAC.1